MSAKKAELAAPKRAEENFPATVISGDEVVEGGGCPVKRLSIKGSGNTLAASSRGDVASIGEQKIATLESEFEEFSSKRTKKLFDGLRDYGFTIEKDIAEGNTDLLNKESIAFLEKRHALAVQMMTEAHSEDFIKKRDTLNSTLVARNERKRAKREARFTIRSSKKRDQIIQQQEHAAQAAARVRESVNEKRAAFDALTQHMYDLHSKQNQSLVQAQDRRSVNEKLLVDLETRHLTEELRNTLQKKFQVRQNHQGRLNKRINDNLREYQLLELRHVKEKFEYELFSFEALGSKKIFFDNKVSDLKIAQMNEMHAEKENDLAKHEGEKEGMLKALHARELKTLSTEQRRVLRQLKLAQDEKLNSKTSQSQSVAWSTSNSGKASPSKPSTLGSRAQSITSSVPEKMQPEPIFSIPDESDEEEVAGKANINSEEETLPKLRLRHEEELAKLNSTIRNELNDCRLQFDAKMTEMSEEHIAAISTLVSNQERDVEELRRIQANDIMMEESMHDSEMKMLVERRILNSVLETVADGIINITPIGVIVRFNSAAETMFGYKASEVIGINIYNLMPERFSRDHHIYLTNYLTTGIKKVIGSGGRRVFGLRKDGTEFPLHLTISELKDDDEHLFTGIARDLTEEVEEENRNLASDAVKQKELEELASKLDVAKEKANNLLSQMLPEQVSKSLLAGQKVPPQLFQCASVMFLDVFGFSAISEQIHPLEVVTLLNDLYRTIDQVVEKYDVYKVETVGDTYMLVSGVPKANTTHAGELATMALHLLQSIDKFIFEARPEIKIRVRVGINTGQVVAGVIGSKMPRYCLFGDVVNTASRMVTNGQAGKIHISASTHDQLKHGGNFTLSPRGQIEVKGKGMMTTYWVDGKI